MVGDDRVARYPTPVARPTPKKSPEHGARDLAFRPACTATQSSALGCLPIGGGATDAARRCCDYANRQARRLNHAMGRASNHSVPGAGTGVPLR